jgi:hypothetical protein
MCFLRSAASLSASADFAVFPVSALGAMAEAVMEFEGVDDAGGGVGLEGCSASTLRKRGSGSDFEIGNGKGRVSGTAAGPLFMEKKQSRLAFPKLR